MQLVAAMGPPGGGRMEISRRLQSRFNLINMTFPQVGYETMLLFIRIFVSYSFCSFYDMNSILLK